MSISNKQHHTVVTCFPLSATQKKSLKHRLTKLEKQLSARFDIIFSSDDAIDQDILQANIFCGHAKVPVPWPQVVRQGKLRWIQSTAAGLDHCLVSEVVASNILVSGCSGLFAIQVAEQTLALLTGLIRRTPVFFRAQQLRQYERRPTDNLFNKSVGILGMGGNGQQIARVLRPLVKQIVATDLFEDYCQRFLDLQQIDEFIPVNHWKRMLSSVDVLIVTLPLSASNNNLIGTAELDAMKQGSYLINVGRGSVVNSDALYRSLEQGKLAGAGIDVVEPEPLPADSPLWNLNNIMITPHVGAQSPSRVPLTIDLFLQNVQRFCQNQTLWNVVDKQLGFPRPEHRLC